MKKNTSKVASYIETIDKWNEQQVINALFLAVDRPDVKAMLYVLFNKFKLPEPKL